MNAHVQETLKYKIKMKYRNKKSQSANLIHTRSVFRNVNCLVVTKAYLLAVLYNNADIKTSFNVIVVITALC